MYVVEFLIRTDGIHVGIDAIPLLNMIVSEYHTFPLGEGVYDFRLTVTEVFYREGDRSLHAIEVVVKSRALKYEEGGGDSAETQLGAEILLEEVFDVVDAHFGLTEIEQGFIAFRDEEIGHLFVFNASKLRINIQTKRISNNFNWEIYVRYKVHTLGWLWMSRKKYKFVT